MNVSDKKTYVRPAVESVTLAEVLRQIGPAAAIYGPPPSEF